ncbi:MAG: RNA methyltransferase [Bacteroides sp.]|nr:RNA methyltransferase [Bacteroides sp.]
MTVSKNRIKYIRSLELKKNRKAENVFLAEGPKLVGDLLGHFRCRFLIATSEWLRQQEKLPISDVTEVCEEELARASLLKAPQQVLAVFEQPDECIDLSVIRHSLTLALDDVQDPGNLGTIVRLADWFGIEHIFCSPNTVDIYNPKAIQATMGGIARVKLHYTPLPELIRSLTDIPIYGTFLDGGNMYEQPLSSHGIIVMGNEGNGIGKDVAQLINRRLYIPSYPPNRETSESLNVAIATAIVCAEFRRRASL